MEKHLIAETEDLANYLVYRLKDTPECELTQECVDRFRTIVHELLVENQILKEDCKKSNWNGEHLI